MPRGHPGLPRPKKKILTKNDLLAALTFVDRDETSRSRVLRLETEFRSRISNHIDSLPIESANFAKFNTSPFVLLFYCKQKGYKYIKEIEGDILPAKLFSSMETSAGRMVEAVALPVYGWQCVESKMHSNESVLDGKKDDQNILRLATLKSGPRCLNDEMSKDIADDIITNCVQWAKESKKKEIDFTYGVLYGTKKQSNKKDWHILRNIDEKLPEKAIISSPTGKWYCKFKIDNITVTVNIRIGDDFWKYLGGNDKAFIELCTALIRACVLPGNECSETNNYLISDLKDIVNIESVPEDYNVSLLQRSQLEWLFFFARHFCDEIKMGQPELMW
jgi:hypothetical protein